MTMNVFPSAGESIHKNETRVGVEELARRELIDYQQKMAEFLQEKSSSATSDSSLSSCPSALELRQKHAVFAMEAIDSYRKNSIGRPILVWKLERELASLLDDILLLTSKMRRDSFNDSRSTSPSPRRATIGPYWEEGQTV